VGAAGTVPDATTPSSPGLPGQDGVVGGPVPRLTPSSLG
jgi:hypothetical protein